MRDRATTKTSQKLFFDENRKNSDSAKFRFVFRFSKFVLDFTGRCMFPFAHAKKILLLWRKWAIPGLCLIYFRVFKQTLPNSYSIILLHKGKHQCILFYWFGFSCFDILTVSTDIALFVEYKPAKQEVSHIAYFSHIVILLADVSWVK